MESFTRKLDIFGRSLIEGARDTLLECLREDAIVRAPLCDTCGGAGTIAVKRDERDPALRKIDRITCPNSECRDGVIPFSLSSGRPASYYVDVARVSLRPPAFQAISVLVADAMLRADLRVVGGPLAGGAPLATAAIVGFQAAGLLPNELRDNVSAFYVRDGRKDHGAGGAIAGIATPGLPVMLVDDVISTGFSLGHAVKLLEAERIRVHKVLAIVDRSKGAGEYLEKEFGLQYEALFTMADLGVE